MRFPAWLAALVLAAFTIDLAQAAPPPPCKTPEELMAAVKSAFEKDDTNAFWGLHTWTNVPPVMERLWKDTSVGVFGMAKEGKAKFTSFDLKPLPPEFNKPRKLQRGGQLEKNVPATGLIMYSLKGPDASMQDMVAYGKGADGNYWLVVDIKTTNVVVRP